MVKDADALTEALGKRTPRTKRGRRILQRREPRAVEDAKTALILSGNRANNEVQTLLKDLHRCRAPLATLFIRKHEMHPFEDPQRLEKMCAKYDHSLFAFGSSSKKRPFRLILGRLFDTAMLDMQEFRIQDYKPVHTFQKADCVAGSKPLVLFQGSSFESNEGMKRTKSLLLDFFSGPRPQRVMLQGLDQVVVCSAVEGVTPPGAAAPVVGVSVKRFRMNYAKSGSRLPHVELEEIGPSFKMELDRQKDPDKDRWKQAIKVPKEVKPKKVKNMSKNYMGKRQAKIHVGKVDFDQIHTQFHGESKRKKMADDQDPTKVPFVPAATARPGNKKKRRAKAHRLGDHGAAGTKDHGSGEAAPEA